MTAKMTDEHTVIIETKKHKTVIIIPTKGTDAPLTTNQEIILELTDDIEQLQGEIERLKYADGQHSLICDVLRVSPNPKEDGDTALEAVCDLSNKYAQLTAKHEKLVKAAKELKRIGISEGEFGQYGWTAVDADDLNLLLTEPEDK
jgi:hypothetical protein